MTSGAGDRASRGLLPTGAELVEHLGFVRRVAGELVRDAATADDVAQDAMVVALGLDTPPRSGVRPWLYGVVRNLVRDRRKQTYRKREHGAVEAEAHASAADVVESTLVRGEHAEMVVGAVLALDDPYRTVVLMRYLEDVDPTEIAERLERPLATVETQLRRGLERVRTELDRRSDGDRNSWVRALAPLAVGTRAGRGVHAAAAGSTVSGAGVAVLLLVATVGALWWAARSRAVPVTGPGGDGIEVAALDTPPGAAAERHGAGADPVRTEQGRTAVGRTAPANSSGEDEAQARQVRVVERATGRPIPGATVTLLDLDLEAIGAAAGLPLSASDLAPGGFATAPAAPESGPPGLPAGGPRVPATMPTAEELDQLLRNNGHDPATFEGRVEFDRDGKPFVVDEPPHEWVIENGRPVRYEEPQQFDMDGTTLATDEEGMAEVGRPRPGTTLVSVSAPGYSTWTQPLSWSPQEGPLVVELDGSGRLVVRRGALPPGTSLRYTLQHAVFAGELVGTLDAERDLARHDDLMPGEYTMDVWLVAGDRADPAAATLQRRLGRRVVVRRRGTTRVRAWERAGPKLRARVIGSLLSPTEGAVVHARPLEPVSTEVWMDEVEVVDDMASFLDLPSGPIEVWVTTRFGRKRGRTRLDPWTGERECALDIGGHDVTLRMLGRRHRAVEAVVVGPLERPAMERIHDVYAVPGGRFAATSRLDPLPRGRYELSATLGKTLHRHEFEVGDTAVETTVDFGSAPGARLSLAPLPPASGDLGEVRLVAPSGAALDGVRLVPGATWQLPPGRYGLRFADGGADAAERVIQVDAGVTTPFQFGPSDVPIEVELRVLQAGSKRTPERVLVRPAGSRGEVASDPGARSYELDRDGAVAATLRPGRYVAIDERGQRAEFDVGAGTRSVVLRVGR